MKAESRQPLQIRPRHLSFHLETRIRVRQAELQDGSRALGKRLRQQQRHAALADISARRFHGLAFNRHKYSHIHRLPEIAPAPSKHEIQRGMKASGRIQRRNGLL